MLEMQVLLPNVPLDGRRRRVLGQGRKGGGYGLPGYPPPRSHPTLGDSQPSLSQGQVCSARNRAAANLRQRSREGSNINFKPARAKGSGH